MFPRIWPAQLHKYAESNVKAAWLLGELSALGPFGQLAPAERLRGLEAALFMVGYEIPSAY